MKTSLLSILASFRLILAGFQTKPDTILMDMFLPLL
jgi:hypothetical protein